MELVSKIIPEPSAQQVADAMRDALPLFQRVGLDGRARLRRRARPASVADSQRARRTELPRQQDDSRCAARARHRAGDPIGVWRRPPAHQQRQDLCRWRARPADRADDRSLRRQHRQSRHQHAATKKRCSRTCARPARRVCRPPFTPSATRPITMCWMCLRMVRQRRRGRHAPAASHRTRAVAAPRRFQPSGAVEHHRVDAAHSRHQRHAHGRPLLGRAQRGRVCVAHATQRRREAGLWIRFARRVVQSLPGDSRRRHAPPHRWITPAPTAGIPNNV